MRLEFADNPLFVHGFCRLKTPVCRLGVTGPFAIHMCVTAKRELNLSEKVLAYGVVIFILLVVLSPHMGLLLLSFGKIWSFAPLPDAYTLQNYVGIATCKWSTNWDSFVPQIGGSAMAGKREKPEEIVSKLRQVEVLQGQGMTVAEAVRQIGVTQQTFYRWRKLYGGMGRSQLKRLKELEKENQRLRRAVSDLTLDKLILTEASRGNF